MWFAFFCAGVRRGGLLLELLLPFPLLGGEGWESLCDRRRLLGWVLPVSGVGAGLLRVDNRPLVVAFSVTVALVDDFATALVEDAEVDLCEVEVSSWPIRLGSIWVVDELSYGRQARAVVTVG